MNPIHFTLGHVQLLVAAAVQAIAGICLFAGVLVTLMTCVACAFSKSKKAWKQLIGTLVVGIPFCLVSGFFLWVGMHAWNGQPQLALDQLESLGVLAIVTGILLLGAGLALRYAVTSAFPKMKRAEILPLLISSFGVLVELAGGTVMVRHELACFVQFIAGF